MQPFKDILNQPEGRRLEFKQQIPEKNQLLKTIIAFANDAGGEIYIGVNDTDRKITGIPDNEIFKIEELISSTVFDSCYPRVIPEISILNYEEKNILKIHIYPGSQKPYYQKNLGLEQGAFIRVGSTNRLADNQIIEQLIFRASNKSYDSLPVLDCDIKIAIFDDMLEITSPGLIASGIDLVNIENNPSEVKNKILAPIFKDLKLIEQWGTGFKKLSSELVDYPNIRLQFNEPALSFQVQFIKIVIDQIKADEGLNEGLNEGLKTLFSLIKDQPGIQANQLSTITDRPIKTIERQIKILTDKQIIKRIGSRKTGGYFIIDN